MMLPFIRGGIAQGLSGNKILNLLKKQGAGIRNQSFQELVRYYRDREAQENIVASLSKRSVVDVNNIPFSDLRQKKKLNYTVRYTTISTVDGSEVENFVTVVTNHTNRRLETIERLAQEAMEENVENYPLAFSNFSVTEVTKRDDV